MFLATRNFFEFSGSQPVQLIFRNEGRTSYSLDHKKLEKIFGSEKVKDKKITIISIAGASRKGKSFLLGLLLHYLKNITSQNVTKASNWWENSEIDPTKGFVWKGGREKCTEGIWIWSRPFFIKTQNNEEVAVFLMDTQGSFDAQSSVKDCSSIFALSTLISSVQVYNIMQHIQEDHLQQLQVFVRFGKVVQSTDRAGGVKSKAFQNLLFLVRDWPDTDVEYGLEGGEKTLKEVLSAEKQHSDVQSVRHEIKTSFDNIQCFLMPDPGRKVVRRGKEDTTLLTADVDEEFMEYVDKLAEELFSPDNLVVKTINGREITGEELLDYVRSYYNVLKSETMPKVEVMAQAMARAAIIKPLEDSKAYYEREIVKIYAQDHFLDMQSFENSHKLVKNQALGMFDKEPKFGDEKFKEEKMEYLSTCLDDLFEKHKQLYNFRMILPDQNKGFKQKTNNREQQINVFLQSAVLEYTERMFELCKGRYIEEKCLKETHTTLASRIGSSATEQGYDNNTTRRLEAMLEQKFKQVEKHNSANKAIYTKVVDDPDEAMSLVVAVPLIALGIVLSPALLAGAIVGTPIYFLAKGIKAIRKKISK